MFFLSVICIIFIVCDSSRAEVSQRCYWCGPLADQVHRSQRAQSCESPLMHNTTCDPGFTYCAIVATSPPHTESRYCVKLYQDECYSLYCNSTKTWKMTCPCRGDLCNGINTLRETEAFSELSKLVAQTHNIRIKRRERLSVSRIVSTDNDIQYSNTKIYDDGPKIYAESQNNDPGNEEISNETIQIIIGTQIDENLINNDTFTKSTVIEQGNDNIENENNNIIKYVTEGNNPSTTQSIETTKKEYETTTKDNVVTYQEIEIIIKSTNESEITENSIKRDITTDLPFNLQNNQTLKFIQISNETKEDNHIDKLISTVSETLPTAKALQQNSSPKMMTESTSTIKTQSTSSEENDKKSEMETQASTVTTIKASDPPTSKSILQSPAPVTMVTEPTMVHTTEASLSLKPNQKNHSQSIFADNMTFINIFIFIVKIIF